MRGKFEDTSRRFCDFRVIPGKNPILGSTYDVIYHVIGKIRVV